MKEECGEVEKYVRSLELEQRGMGQICRLSEQPFSISSKKRYFKLSHLKLLAASC